MSSFSHFRSRILCYLFRSSWLMHLYLHTFLTFFHGFWASLLEALGRYFAALTLLSFSFALSVLFGSLIFTYQYVNISFLPLRTARPLWETAGSLVAASIHLSTSSTLPLHSLWELSDLSSLIQFLSFSSTRPLGLIERKWLPWLLDSYSHFGVENFSSNLKVWAPISAPSISLKALVTRLLAFSSKSEHKIHETSVSPTTLVLYFGLGGEIVSDETNKRYDGSFFWHEFWYDFSEWIYRQRL